MMIKKVFVLCIAALSLFGVENLRDRRNPGFEEDGKHWRSMVSGDPYAIFSRHEGINGSGAAVVNSPNAETSSGFYAQGFVNIIGGHKYTVEASFRGKIESGSAFIAARLWSGVTSSGGQTKESKFVKAYESEGIYECAEDCWSKVHITFTAPEQCNGIHLQLATREMKGFIAFDDIAVYELDDTISIPELTKAPALDGTLDETFRKEATRFTDFMQLPITVGRLAKETTEAYVGMTPEHIYGAFLMHHASDRKLAANKYQRDSSEIFMSDDVEFFITYIGRELPCFHFAFNLGGSVWDAQDGATEWNSGVQIATGTLSTTCELIQFRLPLKDIGYNHAVDAGIVPLNFKMSFGRSHYHDNNRYFSTWSRVLSKFEEPENFRSFTGLGQQFGRTCSELHWTRDSSRTLDSHSKPILSWQIEKPLFKELFSDKMPRETGESAYMWPRPLETINIKFGLQYGVTYCKNDILEEYRKHRLHPFGHIASIQPLSKWERETGIGHCLYFPYFIEDWSATYTPKVYDRMFEMTRQALRQNPDTVWGISLGDEAYEWLLYHFIDNANNPAKLEASPELREAVKLVKDKFGHGKYGVPKSSRGGRTERFEWLATRAYLYDRTHAMQRDLYKLCQEFTFRGKPLVCISGDPMGGHCSVQEQSRDKDCCDIFTGQVVPIASRWRQNVCYTTKLLKDFTGKTVWPCAHVEPYSRSNDVPTTAGYLSEVARGGGTGLQMWNYDLANQTRKMGDTCFDYYGHRPRWDVIMDIADKFRTMPELKFPKDELAIYVSVETFSSFRSPPGDATEALFTFAGPSAGAWFKFVSSTQVYDKAVNLNDWKAILFSNADIEKPENQAALQEYVKNGGTLVCFDADAFNYADDGSDSSANRETLFGAKTIEKKAPSAFHFHADALSSGISQEHFFNCSGNKALAPMDGTRILASFNDGTAAATVKEYPGGGRAILFAVPLNTSFVSHKTWRAMMKQFIANLGIKTDEDIWRFQFPSTPEKKPEYKDLCLTGNNMYWHLNEPVITANAKLKDASYSYSLAPDKSAAGAKYAFGEGNLTNRLKAFKCGDYYNRGNAELLKSGKLSTDMFFDTWSKTDAFDISISLGRKANVSCIKLFYNGELPTSKVKFANGSEKSFKGGETDEVAMIEMELDSVTDNIIIHISKRRDGNKLILSEMEIWGK